MNRQYTYVSVNVHPPIIACRLVSPPEPVYPEFLIGRLQTVL